MKTAILVGLGLLAGLVAAPKLKTEEHWSKWSPPFVEHDDLFKSVTYTLQCRTNLDTGLVERRGVQ